MIFDSMWLQELLAAINAAGAAHISFNPVTKANMDKALQQACAVSGVQLAGEVVTGIADSASGDLRNGLQTLQLAAVGLPLPEKGTKISKAKVRALRMLAMSICNQASPGCHGASSPPLPCFGHSSLLLLLCTQCDAFVLHFAMLHMPYILVYQCAYNQFNLLQGKAIKLDKAMEYTCCKQGKRGKKSKADAAVPAATATSSSQVSSGKDTGLALFHALGKILYNKRPVAAEKTADADSMVGGDVEECLLPVSSAALQMPSSRNKPCEVADRLACLVGSMSVFAMSVFAMCVSAMSVFAMSVFGMSVFGMSAFAISVFAMSGVHHHKPCHSFCRRCDLPPAALIHIHCWPDETIHMSSEFHSQLEAQLFARTSPKTLFDCACNARYWRPVQDLV